MHYRGEEAEEVGEAAFRLPSEGAALSLFQNVLHDEDEESEDLDTLDVYRVAGKVVVVGEENE